MSILKPMTIQCPGCGGVMEVRVYESINADRRPDLRAAILDGTLQVTTCPACQEEFRIDPQFNLLDMGRGQWISVQPQTRMTEWLAEERRAVETFDLAYGKRASPSAREVGDTLAVRLVFGWPALREKLLLSDAGLDDATVELAKLALLRDHGGAHVATGDELRLTGSNDGDLLFAWTAPLSGDITGGLTVPRTLIDEIAAEPGPWAEIRTDLTAGPFVDMQKMFVGEGKEAA